MQRLGPERWAFGVRSGLVSFSDRMENNPVRSERKSRNLNGIQERPRTEDMTRSADGMDTEKENKNVQQEISYYFAQHPQTEI